MADARAGARVVAVDREHASANATRDLVAAKGFDSLALQADVTNSASVAQVVTDTLAAQGRRAIVNISSIATIRWTGYPYSISYATKAGVNQLTVTLALQCAAQGIHANAAMPGLMNTPLIPAQIAGHYASPEELVCARDAACPIGRMGAALDMAHAAVFLASHETAYIDGVRPPVDGGISMQGG